MKTSELTGAALDWAVAKCEGRTDVRVDLEDGDLLGQDEFQYSEDWALGGPIIEREEMNIKRKLPAFYGEQWEAGGSISAKGAGYGYARGPTPLIAAMRCYVASKFGEEIEISEELK